MSDINFLKVLQEWESLNFPLSVSSIKCIKGHYNTFYGR